MKIKTEKLVGKQPISRKIFLKWLNDQTNKSKFQEYKNEANKLFEEFSAIIAGMDLTEKEYTELGQAQSIYPKEQREKVYSLYIEYKKFILNSKEYYDINLTIKDIISQAKENEEKYHTVIIDELQDFTNKGLDYILSHLEENCSDQFLLCGDANQTIYPTYFSFSRLKDYFANHPNHYKINYCALTLEENHRNSEKVNEFSRNILKLSNKHLGTQYKLPEEAKSGFFTKSSTNVKGSVSLIFIETLKELKDKILKSADWAIIVDDDESKQKAKEILDIPSIFTIEEIKGLEYKNIILFTSRNTYKDIWNEVSLGDEIKCEKIYDDLQNMSVIRTSKPKNKDDKSYKKFEYLYNKAYVATTRPTENLYIHEIDKIETDRLKTGNSNFWKAVGAQEEVHAESIDITSSTIDEFASRAMQLIKTDNLDKAEIIIEDIIKQINNESNAEQEKFIESIVSELKTLKSIEATNLLHVIEAKYKAKYNNKSFTKISNAPVPPANSSATFGPKAGKVEVENENEKAVSLTDQNFNNNNHQTFTKHSKSNESKKELKPKSKKVKPASELNKKNGLDLSEVLQIITKSTKDINSISEISKDKLAQQCKEYGNRTLLSALFSSKSLFSPQNILKLSQRNFAKFISNITDESFKTLDDSNQSALDYLLAKKDNGAGGSCNILSRMSKLFNNSTQPLKHFYKILGDNLFKLDQDNWPIFSYFDVNSKIIKDYSNKDKVLKLFWESLNGKYDPEINGLNAAIKANSKHSKYVEVIELILSKKLNIDVTTSEGNTLLMQAVIDEDIPLIELLLKAGANTEITDKDGLTPLMIAVDMSNESMIELLLKAGANTEVKDSLGKTSLVRAVEIQSESMIELLLKAGANPDIIDCYGSLPLQTAIYNEKDLIVEILLKYKANTEVKDSHGKTSLIIAIERGHKSIVKLLLDKGAKVNATTDEGHNALMTAILRNNEDLVEILLDTGADIEAVDNDGATPLIIAARNWNTTIVSTLLYNGANVNAASKNGDSPLSVTQSNIISTMIKEVMDNKSFTKPEEISDSKYTVEKKSPGVSVETSDGNSASKTAHIRETRLEIWKDIDWGLDAGTPDEDTSSCTGESSN